MKLRPFAALLFVLALFSACSEKEDIWNPYYNWQTRNEAWYEEIADSARTAIAEAKAKHGESWEEHTPWRMIQNFKKAPGTPNCKLTDSICARIIKQGTGGFSPAYTDYVDVAYRVSIMPTEYINEYGNKQLIQQIASQTFYGPYNPATANSQMLDLSELIDGFTTAVQYMKEGDGWMVYIPHQLGYKDKSSTAIPAYSTLVYEMYLENISQDAPTN